MDVNQVSMPTNYTQSALSMGQNNASDSSKSNAQPGSQGTEKEQQMIAQLAQEQAKSAQAQEQQKQATQPQSNSDIVAVSSSSEGKQKEASAREQRRPNWSQLSAHVHGYTQLQRAVNLYQSIDRL